jgi:hypothetical protein
LSSYIFKSQEMGNESGKVLVNPLGIRAICSTTGNIEQGELRALTELMMTASRASGNIGKITRQEFEEAIKGVDKFDSSDTELLTSIFTMFDFSGEGIIVIKDLVAGIAGSIVSGTSSEKLKFAMTLYNAAEEKGSFVLRGDLRKILNSINDVVSYFGDPVVTPESVDMIVYDVFNPLPSPGTQLQIDDGVLAVISHPVVEIFLTGQGKVRYAAK